MLRLAMAATLALSLGVGKVAAHEFWISPEAYRWPADASLVADLRVGEEFRGVPQSFIPRNFVRFEILTSEGPLDVDGRLGDIPALSAETLPEGLAVIVHETTARALTWDEWDRFEAFAGHKGLGDVMAMHEARGLDRIDVREDYVRYAKSLVAIGHGRGQDSVVGLRTELVALANPYVDDLAGALPVQLLLDGEPRRMAQVEVFSRPAGGGEAELELFQTDGNGIVVLPVNSGMEYLVNAVTLEPMEPTDPDADAAGSEAEGPAEWRTLWASLTFEVPAPETTP
ncbi:DUF4198 domain-containing protein [Roseibacterium sp. SDUM158016]|uniref:DUF4198 domain-containing protein n=1 Tax=Roseicyclus sediminis TaxID=2980997 RepID=UPI0021CF0ABD|nr:DUF4198 domain-containing protein [Roseibacterium sp. SDUM158016]MCU4651634.1 DUF4198 domain-containing protein [Roseibacterium sp. SDUM158016]